MRARADDTLTSMVLALLYVDCKLDRRVCLQDGAVTESR